MKQDWQQMVDAATAEMHRQLGAGDPRMRCGARFSLAVTQPLNEWYADELARGTEAGVLLQVLPLALGQIVGIIIHNNGGQPALANAVLQLLVNEAYGTLGKASAGKLDAFKVETPRPGR